MSSRRESNRQSGSALLSENSVQCVLYNIPSPFPSSIVIVSVDSRTQGFKKNFII